MQSVSCRCYNRLASLMRFVFSRRFYILLAIGLVPLSLSWNLPVLRTAVIAFDVLLIGAAIVDYFLSRQLPDGFRIRREFEKRFAIGDASKVSLQIENDTHHTFHLQLKDEYPSEMRLDESREADFSIGPRATAEFFYHLTPPRRGNWPATTRSCIPSRCRPSDLRRA